ncbi:g9831 [Coccomyxa viridis]|uniref:G9831 protein n=1 Tax=Coccomyxa viridis TaxID=1274662 RepID=A0ABP1G492_9CHLO
MCRCNTTHCFTEALRCPSRRSRGPVCLRCQNNTEKSSQSGGSSAPDTGRTKSQLNLQDPVETIAWGGNLPSRRRAITGGLSGLAIILASNFGGITGGLLSLDGGQLAGRLKADALFPVAGYKRCLDTQNGYEFRYPSRWLADQQLYRRAAERIEQRTGLDPPSAARSRQKRRQVSEPTAAFGPPGSTGEENVSVIVAPIGQSFRLQDLGDASSAAQRFLSTTVAPEGSDKQARLLKASERLDESGELYYTCEFTVQSPKFFRHNLSVYAVRNGLLYTLNGQCREERWEQLKDDMEVSARSFHILGSRTDIPGWGSRL